jgi:hypothetical protein
MVHSTCEHWEICHTKRSGNGAAHLLAKQGVFLDSGRTWFDCYPECVREIVASELRLWLCRASCTCLFL